MPHNHQNQSSHNQEGELSVSENENEKEFKHAGDIAWQKDIFETLGAAFCRKLQVQIENLVAAKYNPVVDQLNLALRNKAELVINMQTLLDSENDLG